jgi:hypothetical protein
MFPPSRNEAASLTAACRVLLFVGTAIGMFQGALPLTIADETNAQPTSNKGMAPLPRTVPAQSKTRQRRTKSLWEGCYSSTRGSRATIKRAAPLATDLKRHLRMESHAGRALPAKR